jgi:DNA-binding transcriptional LysR family regulator
MDLNEIRVFTKVVQAGSFTAAAKQLHMPKSSVSKKVSDLEERVGARLLQRTTRKLRLTDVGRAYFERTSRGIADLEDAAQVVGRMHGTPRGLLRVTAPLSFSMLGPVVSRFLEQQPEVDLELVCTDRRVDLVEEGFDLAVRAGNLQDSSLIARSLGGLSSIVVAAPRYLKNKGPPRTPEDLAKHACLAFGSSATPSLWVLRSGEREKKVRVSARLIVNDFELMREAALAGMGIGLMPAHLCEQALTSGKLKRVLGDWSTAITPLHALYPSARHLSPKVMAFVETLRKELTLGR